MFSRVALASSALVLAASVALAHPPGHAPKAPAAAQPQPKASQPAPAGPGRNLQVLPADIPQPQLIAIMRQWSQALGVQCSYCHVPNNPRSDANPHKEIARGMVRMTARINAELLPPIIGASATPRVTCATCHRGSPDPELPPPAERGPAGAQRPVAAPPAHIAPATSARPH